VNATFETHDYWAKQIYELFMNKIIFSHEHLEKLSGNTDPFLPQAVSPSTWRDPCMGPAVQMTEEMTKLG